MKVWESVPSVPRTTRVGLLENYRPQICYRRLRPSRCLLKSGFFIASLLRMKRGTVGFTPRLEVVVVAAAVVRLLRPAQMGIPLFGAFGRDSRAPLCSLFSFPPLYLLAPTTPPFHVFFPLQTKAVPPTIKRINSFNPLPKPP